MNQLDYFEIFKAAIDLRDRSVLEFGGAVPVSLVEDSGVASWTALDKSSRRIDEGLDSARPSWYHTVQMDAAEMDLPDESFDLVYSTNCLEHVADVESVLAHTYRVLKPGGIFFTLFSPIWTSRIGHHAYALDGDIPVTFSHGIIPDWGHLHKTREELTAHLARKFPPHVVEQICRCTFDTSDINRRTDAFYEDVIAALPFDTILNRRLRSKQAPAPELLAVLRDVCPDVRDFRTLGYFWVLSKGRPSLKTRLRFFINGGARILGRKLRDRKPVPHERYR